MGFFNFKSSSKPQQNDNTPSSGRVPHVSNAFFEEVLKEARYPTTQGNIEVIGREFGMLFLQKAYEFISSVDKQYAQNFVQSHKYTGGSAEFYSNSILDSLVAWDNEVLPYIQDLPMTVKSILLQVEKVNGGVWTELPDRK